MATMRANPRLQVGSAAWIAEERSSALQIAETEAEEFTFSARNEVEWLNEHMVEIFNKDPVNVAEFFKTPGKLRGKTPRTVRKAKPLEVRAPLSDIFSNTPRGGGLSPIRQAHFNLPESTFRVAEDAPTQVETGPKEDHILPLEDEPPIQKSAPMHYDSGYFGSQYTSQSQTTQPTQPNTQLIDVFEETQTPNAPSPMPVQKPAQIQNVTIQNPKSGKNHEFQGTHSVEGSFHSAEQMQTRIVVKDTASEVSGNPYSHERKEPTRLVFESPLQTRTQLSSPQKKPTPRRTPILSPTRSVKAQDERPPVIEEPAEADDEPMDDVQSPSEGSSPLRPIVRKSSLNFASLPAREPITTNGNRVSRTSHLEQTRTSYFGRPTGGKSLGNTRLEEPHDDDEDDDNMNVDVEDQKDPLSRLHNKTSTQRLQDQISMLGKSQAGGWPASKSLASSTVVSQQVSQPSQPLSSQDAVLPNSPRKSPQRSPLRNPFKAPGAFPEDEEDSWIGPSRTATGPSLFSPRPGMTKSHTTDVMEGIHDKDSIGGSEFSIPKRGESPRHKSPFREPTIPERTTSTLGHMKSVSTSVLRSPKKAGESPTQKKPICVSNPEPSIHSEASNTPPKSPSRSYRGSPLKAAKDKFSSILKNSRGLFASSAAISADAKTSTMSPAASRMGLHPQPSFEDALQRYPYLSENNKSSSQLSQKVPDSPGKASIRKTRASTEKEERRKEEEAREIKDAKEAQKMANQLEKARQKVKEEARVFHLHQERAAAVQKEANTRKEHEKLAKASQVSIPKATRTSPRKTKAQLEAEGLLPTTTDNASSKDVETADATSMPPPAVPRPKSQIGRPVAKRPLKPGKDVTGKAKPPTVIKVDTKSYQGQGHVGHPYHPSNSTLAATLQDSLSGISQAGTLRKKASTISINSTTSTKGIASKSNASKVLEAAARKKEQDELVAKRKREAKEENDRHRAAIKEEERRKEEQQRRQELDRRRAAEREKEQAAQIADVKKTASRQAIEKKRLDMERAKQVGAPPPALRPQPSGDLDKPLPSVPREYTQSKGPQMNTSLHRSQDDGGRPMMATKVPPKRPLQQENVDDHQSRPAIQRNLSSYQHNETNSKRRKTSETFDDDDDMTEPRPKMTAPPIRQSSSRPKDTQPKSIFPTGYAPAPQPGNLQRLATQNNMTGQKSTHPLDMGHFSKAPIPFAAPSNVHKTPARPGNPQAGAKSAKSATRSSPRFQNGENIELPEINTDSEDDDDDDGDDQKFPPKSWTNSPDIRKQIAYQESLDPTTIFGQPAAINMEEVFSNNKDRFHKFRQRTSSANWTGQDRLTEDEIRKDLEGRERIRRHGGWTAGSIV